LWQVNEGRYPPKNDALLKEITIFNKFSAVIEGAVELWKTIDDPRQPGDSSSFLQWRKCSDDR